MREREAFAPPCMAPSAQLLEGFKASMLKCEPGKATVSLMLKAA